MSTYVLAKSLGLPSVALLMVVSSCGELSEQAEQSELDSVAVQTYPDTFESYLASFSNDYEPAQNILELADWSGVVTKAVWVDIEEGRFFGESEERPQGLHLNLVFETDQGRRFYVELPRPFDSSIEQLRSVFPLGSESVIYLQPNNDPLESVWFNTRDDGNEWFFTTPQGWILDHPERGLISPLDYGSAGLLADASGLDDPTLDEWAPNPKVPEHWPIDQMIGSTSRLVS